MSRHATAMVAALTVVACGGCRLDDRPVVIADAPGSGSSSLPDAANCLPRATQIADATIHGDGKTYAGASCRTAGCHDSPLSGGTFVASGTILTQLRQGDGGAYFVFSPAANPAFQIQVAADKAGNFWVLEEGGGSGSGDLFPAFVAISVCPTTKFMPFAVDAESGSCNDCHNDRTTSPGPLILDE